MSVFPSASAMRAKVIDQAPVLLKAQKRELQTKLDSAISSCEDSVKCTFSPLHPELVDFLKRKGFSVEEKSISSCIELTITWPPCDSTAGVTETPQCDFITAADVREKIAQVYDQLLINQKQRVAKAIQEATSKNHTSTTCGLPELHEDLLPFVRKQGFTVEVESQTKWGHTDYTLTIFW